MTLNSICWWGFSSRDLAGVLAWAGKYAENNWLDTKLHLMVRLESFRFGKSDGSLAFKQANWHSFRVVDCLLKTFSQEPSRPACSALHDWVGCLALEVPYLMLSGPSIFGSAAHISIREGLPSIKWPCAAFWFGGKSVKYQESGVTLQCHYSQIHCDSEL